MSKTNVTLFLLCVFMCYVLTVCFKPNDSQIIAVTVTQNKNVLSPSLQVVKDLNGMLLGSDKYGRKIVIRVATQNIKKITSSRAIKSIVSIPEWNPITRLKISYKEKITEQEINRMGFRLIEDNPDLSFMIIEPFGKQINANLLERLDNPKITFATAVFHIKAI